MVDVPSDADAGSRRKHGDASVPVHQPAGRERGQRTGVRKIAGPSPRMPSIPVTTTSVVVATATTSWIVPDRQ